MEKIRLKRIGRRERCVNSGEDELKTGQTRR